MPRFWVIVTLILFLPTCLGWTTGSDVHAGLSSTWDAACAAVRSLGEDAHGYVVSLFGKEAVDATLKTVLDLIECTSKVVADVLKVAAVYGKDVLGALGIDVDLLVKHITPEGVVFVTKWALLAMIGYWLLSVAVCFVAGILRQTLFLLKVSLAIVLFGLILSDTGASAETTAMRLAGLVLGCVLLGVGPSSLRGDATSHLEAKVKILESRLRELEK